jgi:transposase
MESTGVYWKPVWNLLEGQFEVLLVNAQHIKAVRDERAIRKTVRSRSRPPSFALYLMEFAATEIQRDRRPSRSF